MNKNIFSPEFENQVVSAFGSEGKAWLSQLPVLIKQVEKQYRVTITRRFEHQSFNFTALAKQADGLDVVIKLGVPNQEIKHEIQALQQLRGDGIVNLIAADEQDGILLLEYLHPGQMLTSVANDEHATRIAASVIQILWKFNQVIEGFPTTKQWFAILDQTQQSPANIPQTLLDTAKQLAKNLHQDAKEQVLLHGDLHHYNILSATRQPWLAIDPKGVVGEREYEVGAFLRNPIATITTTQRLQTILSRRIDIFAETLNFDRQRLCAWGFTQAVLAARWCKGDDSDILPKFLKCAQTLYQLL